MKLCDVVRESCLGLRDVGLAVDRSTYGEIKRKSFTTKRLSCNQMKMTTLEQERTHPNVSSPLRSCALVWVSMTGVVVPTESHLVK